jgi:hypothetical protein
MSILFLLFCFKITISILAVVLPFAVAKENSMKKMTTLSGQSRLLFRLYAVAIVSLLVNYVFGASQAYHQQFPWAAVIVGIVSNGGAAALLVKEKYINKGQAIMASPLSIGVFSSITIGLLLSVAFPAYSIRFLW